MSHAQEHEPSRIDHNANLPHEGREKVSSKLLGNADYKKLSIAADILDKITDDETFQREAGKFANHLAEMLEDPNGMIHKVYKAFRRGWKELPHVAQWAVLKGEEKLPIAPPVFHTLIETGLIHYNGYESLEDRDRDINEKREWEQKKQKWGSKIAAVFAPKIIEFLPLIDLLHRFQNSRAKVLEIIRHRMDALKIEDETGGKESRTMKDTNLN